MINVTNAGTDGGQDTKCSCAQTPYPRPRNAAHMEKILEGTNVLLSPRSGPSSVAWLHEEQTQSFWDASSFEPAFA